MSISKEIFTTKEELAVNVMESIGIDSDRAWDFLEELIEWDGLALDAFCILNYNRITGSKMWTDLGSHSEFDQMIRKYLVSLWEPVVSTDGIDLFGSEMYWWLAVPEGIGLEHALSHYWFHLDNWQQTSYDEPDLYRYYSSTFAKVLYAA